MFAALCLINRRICNDDDDDDLLFRIQETRLLVCNGGKFVINEVCYSGVPLYLDYHVFSKKKFEMFKGERNTVETSLENKADDFNTTDYLRDFIYENQDVEPLRWNPWTLDS